MQTKRIVMVTGGILMALVIIGFFFLRKNNQAKCQGGNCNLSPTVSEEEANDQPLPTVDSSVKVNLEKTDNGHEVILTVANMPAGTKTLEYSLSYDTKTQVGQGVISPPIEIEGNKFNKQFTLGTCSSGKCVYHEVVGPIKLELKFSGSYGEKLFTKDYQL